FGPDELYHDGELWHSFAHHGSFSDVSPERALAAMNGAATAGTQALRQAGWVAITLGTAWVYERGGQVVANCHKLPASQFSRRRMSVEDVVEVLGEAIRKHLAGKNIILTVSPIRHIKDGLAENARSKAILIEAAHRICESNPRAEYFPAFEIVTDELRDYRFYGPDLVHPTAQTADYVWVRFRDATTDPATREVMARVEQLTSAASHRPLHPDTPSYQKFRAAMAAKAGALAREYPEIDLTREIEFFG
ncbi:MAG: GSCFA domain-containing protein, partial [Rikenellaceae bacterium]|nr:GSCFA domain-containing protein [Rikenellaceae bacterium]